MLFSRYFRPWQTATTLSVIWLVLLAAFVTYALVFNPRIYYAEDDGVYQLLTKSLAVDHSLFIKNGYDETKSPLFIYMRFYVPTPHGELTSQYPPFYPIMGAPFFLLLGMGGLFYLNLLLFLASVWLVFAITREMFKDAAMAHASAFIWAGASFAGPLALTALSHTAGVTLVLAAFYLVLLAGAKAEIKTACLLAAAAGLMEGLSTLSRIDSFFAVAGIAAPLILQKPWRIRTLLSFAAGIAVPLALLAWFNAYRFANWMPFSYGNAQGSPQYRYDTYIPQALIILSLFAAGLLYLRLKPTLQRAYKVPVAICALLAVVAGIAYTPGWAWENLQCILWDTEVGPNPLGDGEKSLLQSCPYMVMIPLSWWFAFSRMENGRNVFVLTLIPLIYVLIYGVFGYPSFIHLYQRFLLPGLPFACILSAHALLSLRRLNLKTLLFICAAAAAELAYIIYGLNVRPPFMHTQFILLMDAPQMLALALLVLASIAVACDLWGRFREPAFYMAAWAMAAVIAWSALMYYVEDVPLIRYLSGPFLHNQKVAKALPPNAFLLVTKDQERFIAPLYEAPGLRLAMQPVDGRPVNDADMLKVINHFYKTGAPVLTFLTNPTHHERITKLMLKDGFIAHPVSPEFRNLTRWTKPQAKSKSDAYKGHGPKTKPTTTIR